MKFVSITMCKNEEDVIERFIRINSRVVDRFIIYDDSSSDRTVEIIKSIISENKIHITLLEEEHKHTKIVHHDDVMNYLMKYAYNTKEEDYEYILPLDADEFIFESKDKLIEETRIISDYSDTAYGAFLWKTFVPIATLDNTLTLNNSFKPLKKEVSCVYKAIVPMHLAPTEQLWSGSHTLIGNPDQLVLDIPLCHFPVRSVNQIIAKALIADHKFSLKQNRQGSEGYHIIKLANHIRENSYNLTIDDLIGITANYACWGNSNDVVKFGVYSKFDEFVEEPLHYTNSSDISYIVRALDTFILSITQAN